MSNFEQVKASHQEKMNDIKLPKKTADEMFQDIRYVPITINEDLIVYGSVKSNIAFDVCEKEVITTEKRKTIKEHLAIHQKLIELGWLNE